MVLYLGEPPVMFLCCCYSFLMCIFICRCSSFCCYSSFISRLLYVTGTPPWLLRPMKASTSSELYPDYFWLPFLFHLPRALRFWVGIFYPQAFFTLRSFTDILTCVYQGFSGSRQYFLEVCTSATNPWFTVIHNLYTS